MASASKVRAGRAFVELFTDSKKFNAGLKAAQAKLKDFGSSVQGFGARIAAAGAAVVAPLVAAGVHFSNVGDAIAKASRRMGIGADVLSEIAYAADLGGTSMEDFEKGVRRMQRTIVEASADEQAAVDALSLLGVAAKDLAGLSPEDQFGLLADRLAAMKDPATRAAAAMEIFGRSGVMLLPMMSDGAAGIQAMREQARRLGLTLTKEDAAAAETLNDAIGTMRATMSAVTRQIGAAVAPMLVSLAKTAIGLAAGTVAWVRANEELIVSMLRAAGAAVAAGAAFVALGIAIKVAAAGLGALAVAMGVVLTPLGLIGVALASGAALWVWYSGHAGAAIGSLSDLLRGLWENATKTFRGIADSLAAGDIELAARVLWAGLRVAWQQGKVALLTVWSDLKQRLLDSFVGLGRGLLATWEIAQHGISVAFIETVAALKKVWANFTAWHAQKTAGAATKVVDAWIGAQELVGSISKEEADAQRRNNRQSEASDRQSIANDRDAALRKIEEDRAAARKYEQGLYEKNMLAAANAFGDKKIDTSGLQAANDELAKLRKEQDSLTEHARLIADLAPSNIASTSKYDPPNIDDIAESMQGAAAAVRVPVAGTFSGALAGRIGGGVFKRMEEGITDIAKNTKAMVKELKSQKALEFE